MGWFIFLFTIGPLLFAFGALLTLSAIPASHPGTTWDATWAEMKEAFHILFHRRRFQVGLVSAIVGFLMTIGGLFPYI